MKKLLFATIVGSALIISAPSFAEHHKKEGETKNAEARLQKWVDAVKTRDAETIVRLYDDEAILLSTFDPKPITNQADRLKYFEKLTKKEGLRVRIDKAYYEENGDIAIANGLYTFQFEEGGKTVSVPARFSFVFENEPDEEGWEIESHHSSVLPVPAKK